MQEIIIDGYNVIYTDDRLRRTACKNLERARAGLLEKLAGYVKGRKARVTVVFDGRGGMIDSESIVRGKLQAVYSAGHETADDLIVRTVRDSGRPRSYIVVTSDRADIGSALGGLGCEIIGSKRFLDRMEGGRETSRRAGPRRADDLGDTDYWLRRFEAQDDADD